MKKFKKAVTFIVCLSMIFSFTSIFSGCNSDQEDNVNVFTAKKLDDESKYDAVFYVSAIGGSDEADGSYTHPFKTIEKARQAVALVNGNMSKDIAVVLREGTFNVSKSITIGEDDGGTNGHDVIYMAYPGENAEISGGVKLTKWTKGENGIYYTNISTNLIRNLYVDGVRATLAREPNGNSYNQVYWDRDKETISVNTEDMKGAENFEIALYMEWAECIMKVKSAVDYDGKSSLEFTDWEEDAIYNSNYHEYETGENCTKCYFRNAKEFLDGEC